MTLKKLSGLWIAVLYYLIIIYSFFILDRPPCYHSTLIIGSWCSKPTTQTIGKLVSVPIWCWISYHSTPHLQLLPVVPSCATSYPYFSSPPSNVAATISLAPLSQTPPDPTTSNKPRTPAYEQIFHRGTQSFAS